MGYEDDTVTGNPATLQGIIESSHIVEERLEILEESVRRLREFTVYF